MKMYVVFVGCLVFWSLLQIPDLFLLFSWLMAL